MSTVIKRVPPNSLRDDKNFATDFTESRTGSLLSNIIPLVCHSSPGFISVCLCYPLQLFWNSFRSPFSTSALQGTFPRVFTDHWTIVLWLQNSFNTISCHLKRLMWVYNMCMMPTAVCICKFSFTCALFLEMHQFPRPHTRSVIVKCLVRILLQSYSEIFFQLS